MRQIILWAVALAAGVPGGAAADHRPFHGLQPDALPTGPVLEADPAVCRSLPVTPQLATDGMRVDVDDPDVLPGMRVRVRGYRYDDAAPTGSRPEGEGRTEIYCGCVRVERRPSRGIDEREDGFHPVIAVPADAPSGDYSFEVLPGTGACAAGGAGQACPALDACLRPSLTVAPAHLVVETRQLQVDGNSEPPENHPSELQFTFASVSGVQPGQGNATAQYSGAFPAGDSGSAHLTLGDFDRLDLSIPLFSAAEDRLTARECREECDALPSPGVEACRADCTTQEARGSFNDLVQVAVAGVERDTGSGGAWTTVAGLGAAALACYAVGDCPGSLGDLSDASGLAGRVSGALEAAVADDDDPLGAGEDTFRKAVNDWRVDLAPQRVALTGGATGDVSVLMASARWPAPRILSHRVVLERLELHEGYEIGDEVPGAGCRSPNELFLQAQSFLATGAEPLPPPERIPAQGAVIEAHDGDAMTLEHVVSQSGPLIASRAPAAPFVFLSVGLWEDDGDRQADLIGYAAQTLPIVRIVQATGPAPFGFTTEGFRVRRAIYRSTFRLEGRAGSDLDCLPPSVPPWQVIGNGETRRGLADLSYRVEVDWLVTPVTR